MVKDNFILCIETKDISVDIAKNVETRFDTSNYELKRLLPKVKGKKGIGLMKGKLGGKRMTEFGAMRQKTYSYLADNEDEKQHKKVCHQTKT